MSDLHTQAPTRLLDDPTLDPSLRADLELARSHAPVAYSVDAGLARFEQSLHGATTVPPGGSVAGVRVLGWFVGAIVLVGGLGYLALGPGRTADGSEASAPVVAQVDDVEAKHEVRAETAPVIGLRHSDVNARPVGPGASESVAEAWEPDGAGVGTASAQATGGGPVVQVPSPPQPTSKLTTPTVQKPAPSLADEAAQINAARKALAGGDPSEALALMEAAEQAFPKGAMIQERHGYTILALVALDRRTDADTRADAYLERWPNGPLSRRVRDALGR
jgi:hypothetical protein